MAILNYNKQNGLKFMTKGVQKLFINIENIMFIQCDGDLSTMYLDDYSKIGEIKTLKEFEDDLSDKGFIRISRNTMINCKFITKVKTNQGNRIIELGEIKFSVSRRKFKDLKSIFF